MSEDFLTVSDLVNPVRTLSAFWIKGRGIPLNTCAQSTYWIN